MEEDVKVLMGVNYLLIIIFLKGGMEKTKEKDRKEF